MEKIIFPVLEEFEKERKWCLDAAAEYWIYGYGRIGKETAETLLKRKKHIKGIIDQKRSVDSVNGIPIIEAEKWDQYDSGIVLICTDVFYNEIKQKLIRKNILTFAPYYSIYLGRELDYLEYNKVNRVLAQIQYKQYVEKSSENNDVILDGLDVVITEKCSLKCKECSNLMQYFSRPQNADYEDILNSLSKVLENVKYIRDINILGGEPFMNKEWHRYVLEIMKYKNIGNILIHTNGTILPAEEELKKIDDKRVVFKLSNYGKVSVNLEGMIELLKKHEICYTVAKVEEWVRCGDIYRHDRSEVQNRKVYDSCCMKGVLSLKDGMIFGCPFAGNAAALQAVPQEINEGIPTTASDEILTGIRELQAKKYLKVCDYCEGRPIGFYDIPAAEQTKEPRTYKQYVYEK